MTGRAGRRRHGLGRLSRVSGRRELELLQARPATAADGRGAEVIWPAARRLSGAEGLTSQHNAFARRHALAEIAGEFAQGASIKQLERAISSYLEHQSVAALGPVDGDRRFTTRDLLACEQAIVGQAERRRCDGLGVLDPALPDQVEANRLERLSEEQMAAVRQVIADGGAVTVLRALAGTGKTRMLGALARIYEAGGYPVLGAAPTGRAARELADAAGIRATTIHRLLAEIEAMDGLGRQTVILIDEAATAPTRPSAALLAQAERAGAKVIAVGDSGQLPSVDAGGWFAAVTSRLADWKVGSCDR